MKTYILNAVQRLKKYSQKLDAQAILYDKSWEVFNENGDKELIIFRTNNELLISRNGIVQKGKWELLDVANIIISVGEKSYLYNAAYIEDELLALKLDGTEQYMIMIEADMKNRFFLNSVKSIESYLESRYKKIEAENLERERLEIAKREEEARIIRANEIEQRRILLETEEHEKKMEFIRKYAKENPTKYKEILRRHKKEKDNRNSISYIEYLYSEECRTILMLNIAFVIFFGTANVMLFFDEDWWYIMGWLLILGMPIALWFIWVEKSEFIGWDKKPSRIIIKIIVNSIVLLIFVALMFMDWKSIIGNEHPTFIIYYQLICLALNFIVSLMVNVATLLGVFSYIDYSKLYDDIIKQI